MKMNSYTRRDSLVHLSALALAALPGVTAAQPGPNMATIFVGLAAGGATDVAARRLAEGMQGAYAQTIIVENRTGASARLAIQHVKAAAPNGASMVLTPASMMAIYPHTYKDLAYDPVADLVPVGTVSISEIGFAVGPSVPDSIKNLGDYLVWIKSSPAAATFGYGAAGSGPHLLGELLGRLSGVQMVHAAYRGSQPAILDLIGGHLPAVAAPLGEFLPHLKTGKIRVLGVTGVKRSRFMRDVPTFKELNVDLSDMTEWFGVFMPAGTPSAVIQRANSAIKTALLNTSLITSFELMGMEPAWSSSEDLGERLKSDIRRWKNVVQTVGFTAQP